MNRLEIERILRERGISFEIVEHEAVHTIEAMEALGLQERGTVAKNLFLRDEKGRRHILVVLPGEKRAELRKIEALLGCGKLSFASPERLMRYLGVEPGAVTPLGALCDEVRGGEVVFDRALLGDGLIGVHPLTNTATVFLPCGQLIKLIEEHGNRVTYLEL